MIPHGPAVAQRVALNPQPLPPGEAFLDRLGRGRARHRVRRDQRRRPAGSDAAGRIVSAAIDDWCGNRPRPIPWARNPRPFPWPPEPEPHPDWSIRNRVPGVVGALSLASVAARLEDGPARDALAKGAEQLLDVGLGG